MKRFFLCIFCFVGCDRVAEKKYLSKDITPCDVKTLSQPIQEELCSFDCGKKTENIEPIVVIPEVLKQKISISLNEKLSVKSILSEAARKLHIDFQMDSSIDSHLIFSARNRQFIEILDAICDMANLRYSINNNFISVVKDTPYTATYDVQFLNLSRDSENKISIATEVSSGVAQSGNVATKSESSDSNVTVKAKNDFWAELENSIRVILGTNENSPYSINQQSGVVTVLGNSKQQKHIRTYIKMIKASAESQVLIEAKIVEVVLKNEYRRGIDWSLISEKINIQASPGMKDSAFGNRSAMPFTGTYGESGKTGMYVLLKAIEEFGSMRTISNPRIAAMNNQAATLKIAQNYVYFVLNYDKTSSLTDHGRDNTSISSEIRTVPIGLVMFVQPSIDIKNGTITLFLRPTISKLADSKRDPAVDIAIRSMEKDNKSEYEPSYIPVTEVREVSSVLKLNDGEIAVLGGFMEIRSAKSKSGLPVLKDIPILGEAASSYEIGDEIVELVILIKVKIADTKATRRNATDLRLQRFVPDPRPF
jgi:general secretion pathway protein D